MMQQFIKAPPEFRHPRYGKTDSRNHGNHKVADYSENQCRNQEQPVQTTVAQRLHREKKYLIDEIIMRDMPHLVTDYPFELLIRSHPEYAVRQTDGIETEGHGVRAYFGFTLGDDTEEPQEEINLMPEEDPKPQRGGGASSRAAYRDINRQLSTFYETPPVDEEKEELKRQVAELTDRLKQQQNATPTADDQMALLEKSYELAAKYMNGQDGQRGQIAQIPTAGQNGGGIGTPAIPVQAIRETTVSGLQQPMSDADFIRAYSQPRNYGFNTAVGTGYAMGKNTVAACIHQDQTLVDGQAVKLRLLEPMQAGNIVVPKNTLVAGTAKVQGERLDILVSSIEYAGNIIPVELAVFDTDGQKGLSVPSSMEQEAFNEAMANIGSGLGTSISFAQSAGQQVAMDVTRGLLQGTSGYLAKKFRTVKVKLKAGYKVMLYAKQQ